MSYPTFGASGTASTGHTSTLQTATTTAFSVSVGGSIYVFIGFAAVVGGTSVQVVSVSDSEGNTYRRAAGIGNSGTSIYPAVDIWFTDNVSQNSALTVTVSFSVSTFFTIAASQILGTDPGGSLDVTTVGATGPTFPTSAPSSMDPITPSNPNELVVSAVCFENAVGTVSSGSGFTDVFNVLGPGSSDTGLECWYVDANTSTPFDSKLYGSVSGYPYAICTVAIRPAFGVSDWSGVSGRPFLAVSSKGIANGLSPTLNDGAEFGVDTPGTTTFGIQEALNSIQKSGGTIYVRAGSYGGGSIPLSSPLMNTGSNQVVVFDSGCSLTFATNTVPILVDGRYFLILLGTNMATAGASEFQNFSYNAWLGNGASINANGISVTVDMVTTTANLFGIVQAGLSTTLPPGQSTPPPAGSHFIIDGFVATNLGNAAVYMVCQNYQAFTPPTPYANQVRNITISRIYASYYSASNDGSGIVINGSVRQCVIEDSVFDCSLMGSTTNGVSNLFVHSNAGDTSQITVRRSTFIGPVNGTNSQVFELQGNETSVSPGSIESDCFNLAIEDCVFDSHQSSPVGGGSGGGYIDDQNTQSRDLGYIYNVAFSRCLFVNTTVAYRTLTPSQSIFGYIRFTNGTAAGVPSNTLVNRIGAPPGDPGITLAGLTSGAPYTNLFGFDIRVFIGGGVVSSVQVNGVVVGAIPDGEVVLRTGDTLTLTFTTAPTVTAQAL